MTATTMPATVAAARRAPATRSGVRRAAAARPPRAAQEPRAVPRPHDHAAAAVRVRLRLRLPEDRPGHRRCARRGTAGRFFATILVPGLIAIVHHLPGHPGGRAAAGARVRRTPRRSRTACSRRCRSGLVGLEKIVAGAIQAIAGGDHRLPDRRDGARAGPRRRTSHVANWPLFVLVLVLAAAASAASFGLLIGTSFDAAAGAAAVRDHRAAADVARLRLLPVGARSTPIRVAASRRCWSTRSST